MLVRASAEGNLHASWDSKDGAEKWYRDSWHLHIIWAWGINSIMAFNFRVRLPFIVKCHWCQAIFAQLFCTLPLQLRYQKVCLSGLFKVIESSTKRAFWLQNYKFLPETRTPISKTCVSWFDDVYFHWLIRGYCPVKWTLGSLCAMIAGGHPMSTSINGPNVGWILSAQVWQTRASLWPNSTIVRVRLRHVRIFDWIIPTCGAHKPIPPLV